MSDLLQMTPAQFCEATNACAEGRKFALTQPTMADVWDKCPRPDWLLWIADKIEQSPDDRSLRLFAVWCARNTPLADGRKTGDLITDLRSIAALEMSERYANGQTTKVELDAAWDAAWAAAWAAARAAVSAAEQDAAWAAAWAAARVAAQDAEWAAAQDAAGAGAWAAQANQLRSMITNPFRKEAQP